MSRRHRFGAVCCLLALMVVAGIAQAQTYQALRTTFVARLQPQPNDCYMIYCFDRSSYDGNTLAAMGVLENAVHVFLRLPAGPWYAQAVIRNRSVLPSGYTTAGYRWPTAVVGDDIVTTAYRTGPGVPETCETHVLARAGTGWDNRWVVKQVINLCPDQLAKDGNRVLIGTSSRLSVYTRGTNGLFAEESRVLPPSEGLFVGEKTLALQAWTIVVGRPGENFDTGAAYIFQRRDGQWSLTETLIPDGAGSNTRFGASVAAYEYNVAVTAPGAVNPTGLGRGLLYLYTGVNDTWFSQEIPEPPGGPTDPFGVGNTFGVSVALRGRRLIVSSSSSFSTAVSFLFERGVAESSWLPRATLAGTGLSIDLSGATALIDQRRPKGGTNPTIVNLPALREPDQPL